MTHFRNWNRTLCVLLVVLIAAPALMAGSQPEEETEYPDRPITVVTPWKVGGAAEIAARTYAELLSEELGVRVDVVSQTGGTGATGTAFVKNAPADGYTILQAFIGPFAQVPLFLGDESQYDPLEDFVAVGQYALTPVVFLAHEDSPWDTMADFIADAQENPDKYAVGAGGQLSLHALYAGLLFDQNDAVVRVVAYPGALAGIPDLLGGDLDLIAGNPTGLSLYPELKGIAVLMDERWPTLPDVPTLRELGIDLNTVATWQGYAVRSETPQPIVDRLIEVTEKIVNSEEFAALVSERIDMTVNYAGPEEFYQIWVDSLTAMQPAVDWLLEKQASE